MKHKSFYLLTYNGAQVGYSGESQGSEYDLNQACNSCGTCAKVKENLIVNGVNKTKKEFFSTFDGDILIAESLYKDLTEYDLNLGLSSKVIDKKGNSLPFYYLNAEFDFPKASSKSSGLIIEEQCTSCQRDGYFNDIVMGDLEKNIKSFIKPVRLHYEHFDTNLTSRSNIFYSWEYKGISNLKPEENKVVHYARPMLIVDSLIKERFEKLKVKNAQFEELLIQYPIINE